MYEIDAVKAKVMALDLEPIKYKLVREGELSAERANELETWYKRFLFLTFKYRTQPIVVCDAIDAFWHQHILDTRKYAEDCDAVFGEFLHHFPYFGLRGEEDERALQAAYRATLELMRAEFGEIPSDSAIANGITSGASASASSCSDCSNVWPAQLAPFGDERPSLAGLV